MEKKAKKAKGGTYTRQKKKGRTQDKTNNKTRQDTTRQDKRQKAGHKI
jgi:hypothetical protein